LIGFVFRKLAEGLIFIVLCHNRHYVHLNTCGIGLVLHTWLNGESLANKQTLGAEEEKGLRLPALLGKRDGLPVAAAVMVMFSRWPKLAAAQPETGSIRRIQR